MRRNIRFGLDGVRLGRVAFTLRIVVCRRGDFAAAFDEYMSLFGKN
jgi:hypothetical protein